MRTSIIFVLGPLLVAMAQEKSTLTGVVRDAQTKRPIQGAKIYLSPYDLRLPDPLFPTLRYVTDSFIGFQTTTDVAGRYRLDDLPPHRYYMGTEEPGYGMCEDEPAVIRTFAGRSVEWDIEMDQAAHLRVRFIDRDTSNPVDGVHANLLHHEYAGGVRQWVGVGMLTRQPWPSSPQPPQSEFEVCPRREIYLEITPNESERITVDGEHKTSDKPFYGRGYYPDVSDLRIATPIVLAPGEHRDLEIPLAKEIPRAIRVEIENAPEDSLIHLALERRTAAYFPSRLATALVRAKDLIQLEGLSAADYTLIAWTDAAPGHRFGSVKKFSAGNSRNDKLRLDLQPSLTLKGLGRTDGTSAGKAVEGWFDLYAMGRADTDDRFSQVKFKDGGRFQIDGLLPGDYTAYAAPPPGWIVSKIEYGAADALRHTFTLDNASPGVKITLSRGFGAVTGRVTDGSRPMDNAVMVLVSEPIPEDPYLCFFPWSHLDENGRYEFRYIAPGRYRVIPFYGSTLSMYQDLQALREHAKGYREVVVQAGRTSTGIDFAIRQ